MSADNTELEAVDVLQATLDQLRGLSSCLIVLGEANRSREITNELVDDALPMLGSVMLDLTQRAIDARTVLETARQARSGGAQ